MGQKILKPFNNYKIFLHLSQRCVESAQKKIGSLFYLSSKKIMFSPKPVIWTDRWTLVVIKSGMSCQGSGIGHVANNYLRPILLLPKKNGFR